MAITNETKVLLGVLVGTIALISIGAWLAGSKNTVNQETEVTPIAEIDRLVRDDDPIYGDVNAPVTVVEFGDFECSACAALHTPLKQVKQNSDRTQVRYVYRQFPLTIHEFAQSAAEASLAAQAQGKFWEYHDSLFENQSKLTRDDLIEHAKALELDIDTFTQELDEHKYEDAVKQDQTDGNIIGVNSTPAVYINGVRFNGNFTVEALETAIAAAQE